MATGARRRAPAGSSVDTPGRNARRPPRAVTDRRRRPACRARPGARYRPQDGVGDHGVVLPPRNSRGETQRLPRPQALHIRINVEPAVLVEGFQADEPGVLRPVGALIPRLGGQRPLAGPSGSRHVTNSHTAGRGAAGTSARTPDLGFGLGRDGAVEDGRIMRRGSMGSRQELVQRIPLSFQRPVGQEPLAVQGEQGLRATTG